MLLLSENTKFNENNFSPTIETEIIETEVVHTIQQKIAFYHLLAEAHYKTTPTDLRRLFDAPNQYFYKIEQHKQLIAACWAVPEGGLDETLTQAIWRGERRPQGSLVAQYLCFQGNLPTASRLRSIRISRLAVMQTAQQQGYGKRLVLQIISQIDPLVDFISVSFGMSEELLQFWEKCGFQLVQITLTAEASSGYRSAMMIYPISPEGKHFAQYAHQQFERDLFLQPFYRELPANLQKEVLISPLVYALNETDWQNLTGFSNAKRSFASCYVSLKRLCVAFPEQFSELKSWFETQNNKLPTNQKRWISQLRENVKHFQFTSR